MKYTKKLLEHFQSPHNQGKIKNADGVGEVGNIKCGDIMKLYLKVGKNKKGDDIIKDIKFETLGCAAAIGATSMLTDLAKGKTFDEALNISKDDIVKALGGVPPIKHHCSVLAQDALKKAIASYKTRNS
ncbi:iron-sulfur cluster assembly scaffold protein [Candidatus Kuenenbacteria bacterium]|nr:iron-sulfur cluster assembly scaffold protein [Candidatus Kuenenbacteria bacterium]